MEASESEKVIQHLNQELKEAHDQANAGKQKCVELQGKGRVYFPLVYRTQRWFLQLLVAAANWKIDCSTLPSLP